MMVGPRRVPTPEVAFPKSDVPHPPKVAKAKAGSRKSEMRRATRDPDEEQPIPNHQPLLAGHRDNH